MYGQLRATHETWPAECYWLWSEGGLRLVPVRVAIHDTCCMLRIYKFLQHPKQLPYCILHFPAVCFLIAPVCLLITPRLFLNSARLFFNYPRLFVNSSRLFSKTNTDFQNLPTASPSVQYLAF